MKYTVLLLLLIGFAISGSSKPPKQVYDLLKPILDQEVDSAGDTWAYSGDGGYVLRFDLDITGDGIPEMFLASTLESSRSTVNWHVYKGTTNGNYIPFTYAGDADGIRFNAPELSIRENPDGTKSVVGFGEDHGKYYYGEYSIEGSRIIYNHREIDETEYEKGKASPDIKTIVPEISGVLLFDLLKNPNDEWRRFDFGSNSLVLNTTGFYVRVEDLERFKSLSSFGPEVAEKWLETAARGETPKGSPPSPSIEVRVESPSLGTGPTPHDSKLPKPVNPGSLEPRSFTWMKVAAGMLAVIVIVVLLVRRRSQR